MAPDCDEEVVHRAGLPPAETARRLARAKAESVYAREPSAVVIGSDQVCALGERCLHKPGTAERAVDQLLKMQGRTHALHTAVCILGPGEAEPPGSGFAGAGPRCFEHLDTTELAMRVLSREQIERYVARDQPLDCAGSYKLEQAGIALFGAIRSADQTAIVGLPLVTVVTLLARFGIDAV